MAESRLAYLDALGVRKARSADEAESAALDTTLDAWPRWSSSALLEVEGPRAARRTSPLAYDAARALIGGMELVEIDADIRRAAADLAGPRPALTRRHPPRHRALARRPLRRVLRLRRAPDRRSPRPRPERYRSAPMNRVLVTGGAGTIGAAVVRRLLRDPDFEVRVSDQRDGAATGCARAARSTRGDLRDARRGARGDARLLARHPPRGDRRRDRELPQAPPHADRGQQRALQRASSARRSTTTSSASSTCSSSMVFERATRVPDDRGAHPRLPDPALGLRLLQAHRRGLRAAPRTTSTACRTRSAARSTPTGRARCPRTSRASPTWSPT